MPVEKHPGIGKILRQARKERDSSIEELAWRTKIRPEVLRALEKEHFAGLGHHAFVRTLLTSYARALGLDAREIAGQYRRRYEPEEPSSLAALDEQRKTSIVRRPRFRWIHAAALAAIILGVVSGVGLLRGPGRTPVVRSAALRAGVERIDRLEEASKGAIRRAEEGHSVRGVALGIVADRATFVHVAVDGVTRFEGLLSPGTSRYFSGAGSIELRTTSAATLRLWVNGAAFTPSGRSAYAAVFGPSGLIAS